MYQVFEKSSGKRRYIGNSFEYAEMVKEELELIGIKTFWVFAP